MDNGVGSPLPRSILVHGVGHLQADCRTFRTPPNLPDSNAFQVTGNPICGVGRRRMVYADAADRYIGRLRRAMPHVSHPKQPQQP